jgi:hypothetical protein
MFEVSEEASEMIKQRDRFFSYTMGITPFTCSWQSGLSPS